MNSLDEVIVTLTNLKDKSRDLDEQLQNIKNSCNAKNEKLK